jgi:DNA-binding response OmpR family regulator
LEIGADDYVTKPFHVRELVARVRSVIRRAEMAVKAAPEQTDAAGEDGLQYLFDGMIAIPDKLQLLDRDGVDSPLTSGDFKLLSILLERPKRVLSRDQLMDLIGGHGWNPLDRTVDNQIARLRKKIERTPSEPQLIKTVRGIGYTLACDVERVHPSGSSAPAPRSA